MALRSKFAWTYLALQLIFVVIFAIFVRYGPELDPRHRGENDTLKKDYPMFQDINAMIFIGIGLLYAFLRRYGYAGLGLNFLLCAISVEWGIITQGWWKMKDGKFDLTLESLYKGEFASASAVIAMGAVFGKTGMMQLLIFSLINVLVYSTTYHFWEEYLMVTDVGEAVALHLFSAVFGCSATYILDRKKYKNDNPNEAHSYDSNIFCILGTFVLWAFWPSFNAIGDEGDSQYRSVVNSFLALIGSGITCFAMSALLHKDSKITMVHVQNGALAGAVGVSTTANLMIQPFGALAIGALSGCLCVIGFKYFSPFLARLEIYDVCGINSLHGLPGIFAGILGVASVYMANEDVYGYSLYKLYPAMAPPANTTDLLRIQNSTTLTIGPGLGRTASSQAMHQFIYIIGAILSACITGLITGGIMRMKILEPLDNKQMFVDDLLWDLSDLEITEKKQEMAEAKHKSSEEKINSISLTQKM